VVRPFEFISEMYALPRYGTMDLTRWFAPFYMIFFAFCLADAGYGALLFLGGLALALKGSGAMKAIGTLSMWCGGASVVFGFFAGSLFGLNMKEWGIFAGAPFFPTDDMFLFILALALGVLQILFGMVLKVITTARAFGIKWALSTIGWIVVLVSGGLLLLPDMAGFEIGIPPMAFYILIGIGVFMMLFLNSPGKNPFVNLGSGLWNTYNDVTGFLSDALSYIRLFAIGLSGGVLATVFNDLAVGMSPDIPVLGQLVSLIILLIGHGLNLFMSTLSSMVHPLRLTFVEFYKNAGFEASQRTFDPLKKSSK
jgi:V/A-type H+-transporting ATPase subunit I